MLKVFEDRRVLEEADPRAVAIVGGLIAHQVFRKYETYSFLVHATLLFGPPVLLAATYTPPTFSAILSCLWTYLATLAVSILAYRLTPLHPLWQYPGPFWCRTAKFWHACLAFTGERHKYLQVLHETYGDVVRFGPNDLSIRDASVITQLMGSSGLPKGPNYHGGLLTASNPPLVGIQDTQTHLSRRRPWTRGLSPSALKEYEPLVRKRAKQLVRLLEAQDGVVVLGQMFNHFSYDLMCDMAFGGGAELMKEGDPNGVWAVLDDGSRAATFFHQMDWLGVYFGYIPAAVKPLQDWLMHGKKLTLERMARGSTTRDLFHYLNYEDIPDKAAPPLQQLVDDGLLAVVAGSDTSSSCLTSIFFELLTHAEAYESLQAEVDRYYPVGEDASETKHHRDMVYLNAVIHEALRLFPPVLTSAPRKVPAHGLGVHVGSLYIPPGTSVTISPYVHQRDPRNFSLPEVFWPERWLVASGLLRLEDALPPSKSLPLAKLVHNEVAFLAFSHGPLNCAGKGFALQEIRTVVCALMQRFALRLDEGWDPREYEAEYKDYFVSNRPRLPVRIERRS